MVIRYFGVDNTNRCVQVSYVLSIWSFFAAISYYLGSPVLVAFGYPKPFNKSVLYSTLVLVASYSLMYIINWFNVFSFATALIITESFIAIYRYINCKKYKIL